jgi:hypothetical protein
MNKPDSTTGRFRVQPLTNGDFEIKPLESMEELQDEDIPVDKDKRPYFRILERMGWGLECRITNQITTKPQSVSSRMRFLSQSL